MADLLIRGASEDATIIVTLGKAFNAISGEGHELVALPTHGRLIDADELLNDVRQNSESYFADDFAHEWVDRQPTVIEASEVE